MALNLKAVLGLDASGFELGIKRAQSQAQGFSNSLKSSIGSQLKGILSAAAVTEASRRTIDFAGNVNDLSLRLGISTDAVQKWDNALRQNGSSIDAAAGFFERLAVAREKALGGDSAPLKAFQKMGVSGADLKNLRLEDIAKRIGDTVRAGDIQSLIGPLRELGGRGAGELVAAFKSNLSDLFEGTPLISAENIVELDALGDKFVVLGKTIMSVMGPVLGFINRRIEQMSTFLSGMIAGPAAFLGALMGGASFSEANAAWNKARTDVYEQYAKQQDEKARAVQEAKAPKGVPPEADPIVDKAAKAAAEKVTIEKADRDAQLNQLQQMGGLSRSNRMQTAIDKNTSALNELTREFLRRARTDRSIRVPQSSDAGSQGTGGVIFS